MRIASLCVLLAGLTACAPATRDRRVIATAAAPAALAVYSQGIQVGRTVYVAGQIGIDPATGALVPGGIQEQARQAILNAQAILEAAGLSLADVVQVQAYLADLDDYQAFNAVYAPFFPTAPPARAVVQVSRIPRDARVEIMMIATR